jgi:hypothetical protein
MRVSNFNSYICSACLAFLFVSSASHAEIYKWVDAQGRTHYSENKDDAGKAKPEQLNVAPTPPAAGANGSSTYWQERDREFRRRQALKPAEPPPPPPKSLSGGRSGPSDASKCNLARDVLNGTVVHPNGKPTDKYDRDVAENDVRSFCR